MLADYIRGRLHSEAASLEDRLSSILMGGERIDHWAHCTVVEQTVHEAGGNAQGGGGSYDINSTSLWDSEAEQSQSHSISGTLKVTDIVNPELSYLYINQPKPSAPETMEIHRGTATLELKGDVLEGDYYTGLGRMTYGFLRLSKIKNVR